MRFSVQALVVALAAEASFAFAPSNHAQTSTALNVMPRTSYEVSHYASTKPPGHPDYGLHQNNAILDEFSGLPFEDAEERREEKRVRAMLLANKLQKEREEEENKRIEAEEAAYAQAAAERQAIREADEAREREIEEAREAARQKTAEMMEEMRAQEEAEYQEMLAEYEAAEEEYQELSDDEKSSIRMKEKLSAEDVEKMQGLTGWRRMQFMDNTLDGNIIKRFPRKHADHPDSRTNNKHIDMNNYVELTMEEYEAMREEGRLEARRLMYKSNERRAMEEAAKSHEKMASIHQGRLLNEAGRRIVEEESTNRIIVKTL